METLRASPCISFSSIKKKKKNRHQLQPNKSYNHLSSSKLSSSLTPLSLNQTPHIQTKHQALDQVLTDLQKTIDRNVKIEPQIFSSLLETCFKMQTLHHAIRIHHLIPPNLLRKNIDLSSKLLRLYASFGLIEQAHQLFDKMPHRKTSAFAWNSLISGYAELGFYEDAMALYYQMEEEEVEPDQFTFPRVLKACAGLGSIQIGEAVHRHVVRSGFATDVFVVNALVDMYAKCGDIIKARNVFDKMPQRDSISWNSMLTGYIRHGLLAEVLDVFGQMIRAGFDPDSVAISTILTGSVSLELGTEIHGWALRRGLDQNLSVANSLISMYSQRGQFGRSRKVFDEMLERDIVSWNAILKAHSKDREAVVIFERMEALGVLPDRVTFVSLLSACANSSLVEDGLRLFEKMERIYGMKPGMEHCACMVNLLGRAGLVDEAYEFIAKRMAFEAGPTVWGALLYSCSVHGNVEVGEVAAERLFELEPDNGHNFELLMKIYRNAGRMEEEERVRRLMTDRGLEAYD
ncbi:tetratricopeptide repeat (TPR)-like superfamily protein [Tasmannia lanceolata]|uniref:tetratricopeptide repeat (TPR)-like superfamily protein n=1 Tax=Tasmannia lanceolata TaxID=3420 RepID=UPI004063FA56